jgi:hypothetical protein
MHLYIGHPIEWQLKMMTFHGGKKLVSFDATFGTNTLRIRNISYQFLASLCTTSVRIL